MGLRGLVRPQRRPRRSPPWAAAVEVKEIDREPADVVPQVFCTVLYHGDEFDMLEEEVASKEVKTLRANLSVMTVMMRRIEVS